jgi:hypothetical protein
MFVSNMEVQSSVGLGLAQLLVKTEANADDSFGVGP